MFPTQAPRTFVEAIGTLVVTLMMCWPAVLVEPGGSCGTNQVQCTLHKRTRGGTGGVKKGGVSGPPYLGFWVTLADRHALTERERHMPHDSWRSGCVDFVLPTPAVPWTYSRPRHVFLSHSSSVHFFLHQYPSKSNRWQFEVVPGWKRAVARRVRGAGGRVYTPSDRRPARKRRRRLVRREEGAASFVSMHVTQAIYCSISQRNSNPFRIYLRTGSLCGRCR